MTIGIYSLQKVLYQGEANSVNCKTRAGEITILDHHRPLISVIEKGTMTITDKAGKEHFIPVRSGFLEVQEGSRARFLVEEEA